MPSGMAAAAASDSEDDFVEAAEQLPAAHVRQLRFGDFVQAMETYRPSNVHANEYRQQQAHSGQVGVLHKQ